MKTEFKEENNNYVMMFDGRLDTAASAQTEKEMQVLNNSEGHDIILDCTHLTYISSSGLRLFLGLLKTARKNGNKVTITGLNESVRKIFDEIGFTNLFGII